MDRAFEFLYLNGLSFAGKGEHFGYCFNKPQPKKNLRTLAGRLDELSERLSAVLIEKADFADVIRKYDSPETVFYCDPPYVDFVRNGRYDALTFERLDQLFTLLSKAKGTFLMSEENHPEVTKRAKKHGFAFREVKTTYTISKAANGKRLTELLISNYELPEAKTA